MKGARCRRNANGLARDALRHAKIAAGAGRGRWLFRRQLAVQLAEVAGVFTVQLGTDAGG